MSHVSLDDKIAAIDQCIEDFRWSRAEQHEIEYATYTALKAIANDLRARRPGKPEETRRMIGRAVAIAVRGKGDNGYGAGHLREVAEATIGRWPVLEQALERFERELEGAER